MRLLQSSLQETDDDGPHEAWLDVRDLPAMRSDENPNVVERWMKACGKLPD